jgi:hypothetical protein
VWCDVWQLEYTGRMRAGVVCKAHSVGAATLKMLRCRGVCCGERDWPVWYRAVLAVSPVRNRLQSHAGPWVCLFWEPIRCNLFYHYARSNSMMGLFSGQSMLKFQSLL